MKTLLSKRSIAVAAAGGLASIGLLAAPAMANTAGPGHTDIVEITCDANGFLDYNSEISGAPGDVAPGDLDDWTFNFPEGPGVEWDSGLWSVDADEADPAGSLPDVGFNYHVETGGELLCPELITITLLDGPTLPFGDHEVQFNGQDTVTLGQGGHIHGVWTFESDLHDEVTYDVGFKVEDDLSSPPVFFAPAEFVVGS